MKRAYIPLSETYSKKALEALRPEAEEGMNGVEVDISLDTSEIEIDAEDSGDLRAALNSYLRWLNISKEITDEYEV
ncbi:MAG: KEOPS complex subunit Pcc1 [Candidatus Thermoplasmatota archaeon]